MRRRRASLVAVVTCALAAGACGHEDDSGTITSTESPSITVTTTPAEASEPSNTSLGANSTSPSTAIPTASTAAGTTTTLAAGSRTTAPPIVGSSTLGPPAPSLLPAQPPGEIDWDAVGPDWLLIDHPESPRYTDLPTMDQRGLYLVSPDDVAFGVSALPTDGSWIADVSRDGRRAVLQRYDHVCDLCSGDEIADAYGFDLLELETTERRTVIEPVPQAISNGELSRRVSFTSDALGLWVSETWRGENWRRVVRVRLSRVDIETGGWTTILDEPTGLDLLASFGDRTDHGHASVLEVADGNIVTESPSGIWLRGPDGAPVRQLDAPGTACRLDSTWDDEYVVAQCNVPGAADEGCWTTGLWLVALDGGLTTLLAAPVDDDEGNLACYTNYFYAERLGEMLAIQEKTGEGDCITEQVVLLGEDGPRPWEPAIVEPCGEHLLGIRNGAWLITAGSYLAAGTYQVTPQVDTLLPLPPGAVAVIDEVAYRPW